MSLVGASKSTRNISVKGQFCFNVLMKNWIVFNVGDKTELLCTYSRGDLVMCCINSVDKHKKCKKLLDSFHPCYDYSSVFLCQLDISKSSRMIQRFG